MACRNISEMLGVEIADWNLGHGGKGYEYIARMLVYINLTDSHHWYEKNLEIAGITDIAFPGHEVNNTYLSSANALILGSLPLSSYQWSRADATSFYRRYEAVVRSDALYGGFRYYYGMNRNSLIRQCTAKIHPNTLYLRGHAVPPEEDRYYNLTDEQRFRDWMGHKVCLQLPIFHDITARIFDSLLSGQIPIIPHDLAAFDHIVPLAVQKALPIIKFAATSVEEIDRAFRFALQRFDEDGVEGARRRHQYCVDNHMLISTVAQAISSIESLTPDITWANNAKRPPE